MATELLETNLETNLELKLARIEAAVAANALAIADLQTTVNSLLKIVEIQQNNLATKDQPTEAILTELRGLKTETQRLSVAIANQPKKWLLRMTDHGR
jgi:hypothetical protein